MSTCDRCMSILPVIVALSDYGSFRVVKINRPNLFELNFSLNAL
jgi:hypothetical protein